MKLIIFLLSLSLIAHSAPTYQNVATLGAFTLQQGYDNTDQNSIFFKLTGNNAGWVAMGIGKSMWDFDTALFQIKNNAVTVEDRQCFSWTAPKLDAGTQSITSIAMTHQNGAYNLEWKRPLAKQTDVEDFDVYCGDNNITIAYHSSALEMSGRHTSRFLYNMIVDKANFPRCVERPAVSNGPSELENNEPKEFKEFTSIQMDGFKFYASADKTAKDVIHFKVTGSNKGWVAFSLGNNMSNIDVMGFEIINDKIVVQDSRGTGLHTPVLDTKQDIYLDKKSTYNKSTGQWEIMFRRKLDTGDVHDSKIDATKTDQDISFAFHSTLFTLSEPHSKRTKGSLNVASIMAGGTGTTPGTNTGSGNKNFSALLGFNLIVLIVLSLLF